MLAVTAASPSCVRTHSITRHGNKRRPHSRTSSNSLYRSRSPTLITSPAPPRSHIGRSWTAAEIAEAAGGEVVRWGPPGTISSDTRTLVLGQWFFAIAGQNFDGHDFVGSALEDAGCVGVVGNSVGRDWGRGFVRVEDDTLSALHKLAVYARGGLGGVVVAATGSVGKTTTTAMTVLALESLGRVYRTRGNFNNRIGVALTLVGIPKDADAAVLELAITRKGNILELARLCRPAVRVVLNVGHAHMENFRNLEEVAEAKGELLVESRPGDICVLNADDPRVMSIPVPAGVRKVLFGRKPGCDVRLVLAEVADGGCVVRIILESGMGVYNKQISHQAGKTTEMVEFKVHGPGLHLAMDACAAAAVAMSLGVSLRQVSASLSRFRPVSMRSQLEIAENGIRIINDTYNANLTSMTAAINMLKSMDCRGKRVAVLGDMLELGETEAVAHQTVLNLCCVACFGLIALVGKRFIAAAEKLNLSGKINFICGLNSETLAPKITEMLSVDDIVLVKGSRAMQMENVVDAIKLINGR